jgi:hypothetical protein
VEAVVVPGDDGVDLTRLNCLEQLLVGATRFAAVGRAVVVLQVTNNLPAARAA